MAAKKQTKTRKKREFKNVGAGVAHIHSSFNNTIVTMTDNQGSTIAWASAGNLGFIVGDGRLNYAPETIFESYYSIGIFAGASVSLGWQHFRNPAYNRDRGPVEVFSGRLHYEF